MYLRCKIQIVSQRAQEILLCIRNKCINVTSVACSGAKQNYAKLCKTMQNYAKLCETMRHYAKLYETLRNYAKLCETIRNYAKLYKTIRNYTKLYEAMRNYAKYGRPIPSKCFLNKENHINKHVFILNKLCHLCVWPFLRF